MADSFKMANISAAYIKRLSEFEVRPLTDVTPLLEILPDLSIDEGKGLYIVKVGNRSRYDFEFFVADFSQVSLIFRKLDPEGFLSGDDADKYLPQLGKDITGHSIEAIWQMFLLTIGDFFLPYSKTHSSDFSYILTREDAERGALASNAGYPYVSLLPSISKIKYDSGYFTVYVWSRGTLFRQVHTYHIHSGRIEFQLDALYNIQESFDRNNDSGNILFRDGDHT